MFGRQQQRQARERFQKHMEDDKRMRIFGATEPALVAGDFRDLGPWAAPVLVEFLGDEDLHFRARASSILRHLNPSWTPAACIAALSHENERVRLRACEMLADRRRREAVPALERAHAAAPAGSAFAKATFDAIVEITGEPPR